MVIKNEPGNYPIVTLSDFFPSKSIELTSYRISCARVDGLIATKNKYLNFITEIVTLYYLTCILFYTQKYSTAW